MAGLTLEVWHLRSASALLLAAAVRSFVASESSSILLAVLALLLWLLSAHASRQDANLQAQPTVVTKDVSPDDAEELFKQWTGNVVMADTGVAMPAAQIARAWLHMARSKGLGRDLQGPIQMPLNREIIVKEVWQVRVGAMWKAVRRVQAHMRGETNYEDYKQIWARDSAALVIRTIHDILGGLGLADNQWHYSEILEHVRSLPRDQEVVVTGHSLGGGIALVVGALADRQAVAIQPPGVYHSLAKHEAQQRPDAKKHRSGVPPSGRRAVGGAICHLLRHCGDDAGRFGSCRHEYQPGNTAWNIAQFVWEFLRASFQSSYFHSDFQPTLVLAMGVSMVVVLRHGAPPMLRSVGLVSG
eukprot:s580_g9.t1